MSAATGFSLVKLGWTNPLTDTFSAHPLLGPILDLNDGVTYTLVSPDGLELSAPEKTLVPSGNIRTQGERITRAIYRRNRTAVLRVIFGPAASYAAFIANVRTLVRWIDAAPATPFCVQWQPPSATQPVYLDVVGAAHALPADERDWLRLQVEPVELVLLVRPGLRGDRVTLSNLVVNPGFEAPSGPGVQVFNDSLATANAYTAAGGALTQDIGTTYVDTVLADAPLRYYRLDESSGPTVVDASLAAQNGTGNIGIGFLQTGALAGSSDTAASFNGTTAYVDVPTSGLPSGNAAWTLEGWFKTSVSGANQFLWDFGVNASKQGAQLFVNSSNKLVGGFNSSQIVSSSTVTDGAWHYAAVTWDGTSLTLYLDGAIAAGPTAGLGPGAIALSKASVGQQESFGGNFFNGTLDECALYATALSSTRITAHYTAGHTAPSAGAANTLLLPAGASATFGSPAWGAIQLWQVRFRFRTGMTAYFTAHGSGSNTLGAEIGGGTLYAQQTIAGTQHLLGNVAFTTINEAWYWLQFTQFPAAPGTQCDVQATIYRDNNGAVGAQVATTGPVATFDGVTALSGQAQFSTSGSALGMGGAYSGVHTLALFGPGGWTPNGGYNPGAGSPSGLTALAWDQASANTYPGGAVTSFGAARMDLPPAGTVDAAWETWSGGAPLGSSAIPTATGQSMAASACVRSTGLSLTAALALVLREWDASGNLLRATTLQSVSGNHAAWTTLAGSVTIGATTAYCSVLLQGSDATAGASAGGVIWWDNTQCWNVTTTGQATMPYCELRFPQSPAPLLVTGLQGDLPTPAFLAWGTYLTSWAPGATLIYALGRRAQASANAKLVAASIGFYGVALSPTSTAVLDASSYGGYFITTAMNPAWNPRAFSFAPADTLGVYHLFSRFYSAQSSGNLPNVQTRVVTQQKTGAWFGALDSSDQIGAYNGPFVAPLSASATWTPADAGQISVPALPVGALTDLAQNYLTPRAQWEDLTLPLPGGSTARCNWQLLLPVDGSLLVGVVNNPANAPFTVATRWLWAYHDGLLLNRAGVGDSAAATYSLESVPTASPAHAGGGPGTQNTGVINVNSGADPALLLDPTLAVAAISTAVGTAAGGSGVNQLAAYVADNAGAVLPFHAEISYSPLYLYPR